MNDEMTIAAICLGGFVLLLIAAIVFVILRNKAYVYRKKVTGPNTTLTIVANKNLHLVKVNARFGGEQITFERKRIRKGQTVDFTYPSSSKPAKVTIEVTPGKAKVFEV